MQQELNYMNLDGTDIHAPAETYYTTGSNAGNVIYRMRKLSVSDMYK